MKLSIITVNYNNGDGLEKTIKSVADQSFKNFEYLIIDGNSTDNSKALIKSYASKIDYWVSEPDRGIYDAMNKGIARAKGDYCMFLNSGDYLLDPSTLENVFRNNPTEDIIYGDLKSDHRVYKYPKELTLNSLLNGTIPHQASFIKTALFSKYGTYEEKYPIIADWVFFVKAILVHQVSYKHLDLYISFFEHGGISTQSEHMEQMNKERTQLFMELFPRIFPDYVAMRQTIDQQKSELNGYRNSRLVKLVKSFQSNILRKG